MIEKRLGPEFQMLLIVKVLLLPVRATNDDEKGHVQPRFAYTPMRPTNKLQFRGSRMIFSMPEILNLFMNKFVTQNFFWVNRVTKKKNFQFWRLGPHVDGGGVNFSQRGGTVTPKSTDLQ